MLIKAKEQEIKQLEQVPVVEKINLWRSGLNEVCKQHHLKVNKFQMPIFGDIVGGVHASDYDEAYNEAHGRHLFNDGSNDAGVMFIMNNPGRDVNFYKVSVKYSDETKSSKRHHPVPNIHSIANYTTGNFNYTRYGEFVGEAIMNFKLRNAYLTHFAKCPYLFNGFEKDCGLHIYEYYCLNDCYQLYLKKEIASIKPKVIFVFGSSTYNKLLEYASESDLTGISVVELPDVTLMVEHRDHYNHVFLNVVARELMEAGVIDRKFYYKVLLGMNS